jgi:hypothetical protein
MYSIWCRKCHALDTELPEPGQSPEIGITGPSSMQNCGVKHEPEITHRNNLSRQTCHSNHRQATR